MQLHGAFRWWLAWFSCMSKYARVGCHGCYVSLRFDCVCHGFRACRSMQKHDVIDALLRCVYMVFDMFLAHVEVCKNPHEAWDLRSFGERLLPVHGG